MKQNYSDLLILETLEQDEMEEVFGGRRGADDPAGHDAGDDRGRRGGRGGRGGRRNDDGANHT